MDAERQESSAPRRATHRGEGTRRALLEAGLELFGRHGFEHVTTRQLAGAADANVAAIAYHFGSKEGLYRAVAQHLVDTVGARLTAAVGPVRRALDRADATEEGVRAALHGLVRNAARELLGPDLAAWRAMFIFREQMAPTAAFDILYQGFMRPLHETITLLVAQLIGEDPASEVAVFRAHAVLGQVVGFRVARNALLRRLDVERLDVEQVERIASIVADNAITMSGPGRSEDGGIRP